MPDGTTKRSEKELRTAAEAKAASEQFARELIARGFVEQADRAKKPATPNSPTEKPDPELQAFEELDPYALSEVVEAKNGTAAPVLPRLAPAPIEKNDVGSEPKKKKKKGGKKKKKRMESGDGLDKRVLAGIAGAGVLFVGFIGFIVYDAVLKPPTIVGTWRGSMLDFEIGHPMVHTQYDLILDEKHRASLTLQEKYTSIGTYAVKGGRLKLNLKDEEGESNDLEYKYSLGRATLDLLDPATGKLQVQLIRFLEKPVVGQKASPPPAPTELAAGDLGKIDKAADERLASVELSPKDGAFKLRHPPGWETDTGSRPDNTYSWVALTHESAKIQIYADIQGSLMSGSDSSRDHEEGSETAPVHIAHELYQKTAAEELSDYNESKPAVFKGSQLGEGRISEFTASGGGLFGSKLRGYHVTLLSRDRRISILCHCPEGEFTKLKPTFLAVCRSLSR